MEFVVPENEALEDVIYITRWGAKWLKYTYQLVFRAGEVGRQADKLIAHFDEDEDSGPEPLLHCETHEYKDRHAVTQYTCDDGVLVHTERLVEEKVTRRTRIRKGKRSVFAREVARAAYNKFGERKPSEANLLVTRRWIQKYLEGEMYKDLRNIDKNIAIDRALFLSFVPTKEFQFMRVVMTTPQWEERMDATKGVGFMNRVFGVGRLQFPDLLDC